MALRPVPMRTNRIQHARGPLSASRRPARRGAVLLQWVAGLFVVSVLSGCVSYRERTAGAFNAFERGQFERAKDLYSQSDESEFLKSAEAGTAAFCAGDWSSTIEHYGRAADRARAIEREALISAESLAESLVTLTLNEGGKEYVGEGYERVLLHAHLAIAYLAQGDFSAARVEVRRANKLLESEEELYEKEYSAGGLGHFLSAIIYELEGSPDDAYIDYRRMEAKGVGLPVAGRSLVRLGEMLNRDDELPIWIEKFGPDYERPERAAEIIVIAGVGLGPFKEEVTLPIPTGDGLLQWSVPEYQVRPQGISALQLELSESNQSIETAVIEDVARVAKENLSDRIALLAAKSAVRAVLKRELTQVLDRKMDGFGLLVGTLFTAATERADLRCWQTLPDTFQAARVFVEPGEHSLRLRARGGNASELGTYELVPGETMFVFARTVGSSVYAYPIGGRAVEPEIEPQQEAVQDSIEPDAPDAEPSPELVPSDEEMADISTENSQDSPQ